MNFVAKSSTGKACETIITSSCQHTDTVTISNATHHCATNYINIVQLNYLSRRKQSTLASISRPLLVLGDFHESYTKVSSCFLPLVFLKFSVFASFLKLIHGFWLNLYLEIRVLVILNAVWTNSTISSS